MFLFCLFNSFFPIGANGDDAEAGITVQDVGPGLSDKFVVVGYQNTDHIQSLKYELSHLAHIGKIFSVMKAKAIRQTALFQTLWFYGRQPINPLCNIL